MSHSRLIMTAGFAMFAMFFGSGNLVFPILIGKETIGNYPFSSIGLMVTGVLVPFLGLLGLIYYKGSRHQFFNPLGPVIAFCLVTAILSLLGPFGVVPRCIIVAHGGMELLFPHLNLAWFSFAFCLLLALMAWKPNRVVEIIGAKLTPLLMLTIAILILLGVFYPQEMPPCQEGKLHSLKVGLLKGYQTMDLLAAFFFSTTIFVFIHKRLSQEGKQDLVVPLSLKASLIGAGLLALVYAGFAYLGGKFADQLAGINPEKLIVKIASLVMGPYSPPIVAILIFLACLTTALILATLFSDFLFKEVLKEKISSHWCLSLTLIISYAISLVGFSSLAKWLDFILGYFYPALIGYTVARIANAKGWRLPQVYIFWIILFCVIILDFLPNLPHI